jgi:transcriptional regulator with XRE-family HTH domain
VTGLVSDEVFAWIPSISKKIVCWAARRFRDPVMGERFREEWLASIGEMPGSLIGLAHSISLLWCVRKVERSWSSELSNLDVEEGFDELQRAIRAYSRRFRDARLQRGVTLEDIARITKVALRDLRALENGELRKISVGYGAIFSYLKDLSTLLGPALPEIKVLYTNLLNRSGGLPPIPLPSRKQRVLRVWCCVFGHSAFKQHLHQHGVAFHWSFRLCVRCGEASVMRSEPCSGKTIRRKLDFDCAVSQEFICDSEHPWRYRSLDSAEWRPSLDGLINVEGRKWEPSKD